MASALAITTTQVRQRLQLESLEASDTVLNSAAFIPTADAWANKILSLNSSSEAALDADEIALMIAAKIAYTALKVAIRPEKNFQMGPIKLAESKRSDVVDSLNDEINALLAMLNFTQVEIGSSYQGGDDYAPDGEDLTQIDIADTTETFSVFG
jgi:hypothetical protein